MIKHRMLLILCFAACMAGIAAAQVPIEQRVDHFRCYFTSRLPVEKSPTVLQDQFDVATKTVERVNQLQIVRLCNPVTKITGVGASAGSARMRSENTDVAVPAALAESVTWHK